MANNVQLNAYQIGQRVIPLSDVATMGFPTTGVLLTNCIGSPTRSLSNGINAYSALTILATGVTYYFAETFSALATAIG